MAAADGFAPSYPDPKSGVLLLDDAAKKKWCPRQESHLRPSPSQRDALSPELRGQNWSRREDLRPAVVLTEDVHRFLCFGGSEKMVRHAGDAPASPRWQRGVLLMDEYRKKETGPAGRICTLASWV